VAPVFFAFRVMVGVGVLMLLTTAWSAYRWKLGKLAESRWLLRLWMCMAPMGFVAVLAGWYTTEIGRQPYVIYGLMRTSEAASAVGASSVVTSLVAFGTVYLFVFIAGSYYLLKLLRKGPQPPEDHMRHPHDQPTASRPMSLADDRAGNA